MKYKIITTTILDTTPHGSTTIISSESKVEPLEPIIITDQFKLTQSHKDYNYITLGKYSRIQLTKGSNITVKHGDEFVNIRTHKTQLNRCDSVKKILSSYTVGDIINVKWDNSTSTLELV